MKMKIAVLVVLVAALGLGLFSWTLAAPPERSIPTATVSVDAGEAWIKRNGEGEWLSISAETLVNEGDHVKTGAASSAHVDFFDSATARLDADSEIAVRDLFVDSENPARQQTMIQVLGGRVWSRVLKFIDTDSSYAAQMSDVVATVRGTAFVMNASDPAAWIVQVVESDVDVGFYDEDASKANLITAGGEARVPKSSDPNVSIRRVLRQKIGDTAMQESWFTENLRRDEDFVNSVRDRREQETRERAGALPGSPLYVIKRLGERLRFAVVKNSGERRDLTLLYADRRFEEVLALDARGQRDRARLHFRPLYEPYGDLLREIEESDLSVEERARACIHIRGRLREQAARVARDGANDLFRAMTPADQSWGGRIISLAKDLNRICLPAESAFRLQTPERTMNTSSTPVTSPERTLPESTDSSRTLSPEPTRTLR